MSEYVFSYSEGNYTVSVPADKLRAEGDDNGFKIGYGTRIATGLDKASVRDLAAGIYIIGDKKNSNRLTV